MSWSQASGDSGNGPCSRLRPATVAMDMGYDNNRVYAECDERGCAAIVPLRKNQGERDVRIRAIATAGAASTAAAPPSSASSAT